MGESKTLEVLFSGPKKMVLCAMFGEPRRWWSLADLAEKADIAMDGLHEHLLQLCDGGLVRMRREQTQARYQPDPACPVYNELQSIVAKLTGRSTGGETILVVEDQQVTARITRILLESWGYSVLEAHGPREAIELFESRGGEIHLLLTDVIMPVMSGPQLADELQRRKPELKVVYMSGYPNRELSERNAAFLPKPFNPAGLSQLVRKELDRDREPGGIS